MAAEPAITASLSDAIFLLNDDCLYEIFQYLDLAEQLRFAMVCRRIRHAFQSYCQQHRIVLRKDDLNSVSLKELGCFFEMVGCFVEELIQLPCKDSERNHYVTLVHQHCPNVKRISFAKTEINSECLRILLANMRHMTQLNLLNCSLDDKIMLDVAELSKLEILNLKMNAGITGKHLWKLTNLRELILFDCGIIDEHFIKICKSLKQLQKLNISHCYYLTDVGYRAIPMYCEQLEELKMFRINGLTVGLISRLKRLKLLCYEYIDRAGMECVRQISTLADLETLSLAECYSLTNADLLLLVSSCTKLKHVNVIFCIQVDDEFVYNAIDVLREQLKSKRRSLESGPVLFVVSRTNVSRAVLESSKYLAATALMRLSFANAYHYNYLCSTYLSDWQSADDEYVDFMPFC